MVKITIFMMMINSTLIPVISYPLLMTMSIILQTILLCMTIRMLNSSCWLSTSIFLVMIGGLMVIFMYITSITSNKIMIKMNLYKPLWYIMLWMPMNFFYSNSYLMESISLIDKFNKEYLKMFSESFYQSSIFMFIYLLLMLLMFINMISLAKGPMRKKY